MDCIVLAGGVPREENLLFEHTRGGPKALLDIAGRPMGQWVLDALTGAQKIERIVLVGLGAEHGLDSPKLVDSLPDHGSLLRNGTAAMDRVLEMAPGTQQVVVCGADIPLVTAEMVDGLIRQCADPSIDIYYSTVSRALMEERFPESRRSYVHLVDGDFAGGDIFVVNPRIAYKNRELLEALAGNRKKVLRQVTRIDLVLLLKLLFRRLSVAEAEIRISRVLGWRARALFVQHAEMAMDVDKPFQLEICRKILAGR